MALEVLFYQLFKNNENEKKIHIVIKLYLGFFIFFIMVFLGQNGLDLRLCFYYFFTFLYKPSWIAIFGKKIISDVGESSYFLYLIHENIGILLIFILGQYLMPYGYVFPLLIITLFILFSVLFTTRLDKPINQRLRKMMP